MKITTTDIKEFRDLLTTISKILPTDVPIVFSPEGITIVGLDEAHICLAYLYLPSDYFNIYTVPETVEIAVNYTDLTKILKTLSGDQLSLSVKEQFLHFVVQKEEIKTKLKLNLIELDEAEDLEYEQMFTRDSDLSTSFKFDELAELLKLTELFGDIVHFKAVPDKLTISASGMTGEFTRDYEVLDNYDYERDCEGVYALKYLQNINDVKALAKKGTFSIVQDAPILILPEIDGVVMKFALAPRVEDEDDMFED